MTCRGIEFGFPPILSSFLSHRKYKSSQVHRYNQGLLQLEILKKFLKRILGIDFNTELLYIDSSTIH